MTGPRAEHHTAIIAVLKRKCKMSDKFKFVTGEALDIIQAAIKANGIHLVESIPPAIEDLVGLNATGYALRNSEGKYFIFVDTNLHETEREFVKAHELGHILLGHLDESKPKQHYTEQEANIFASVLVAFNLALRTVAENTAISAARDYIGRVTRGINDAVDTGMEVTERRKGGQAE